MQLQRHLRTKAAGAKVSCTARVSFEPEIVDLSSLISIQRLSRKLVQSLPKLDAMILNAGYGGFTGVDVVAGVWSLLTDWKHSVTWPTYKLSTVGLITQPQGNSSSRKARANGHTVSSPVVNPQLLQPHEPPLGEVFCANVFGHYLLTHQLSPLLHLARPAPGRVVWISSVEAYARCFSPHDMQALRSPTAYEASKRLTDILALTSALPSTAPYVDRFFFSCPPASSSRPEFYVAHPGICATSIVPLTVLSYYFMLLAFYVARALGSPWHTVAAYSGARAAVWLALAPDDVLDDAERHGAAKGKWGSATDVWGRERVARTEVEGWGFGGGVTDVEGVGRRSNGRMRGARDVTSEDREAFEELGRECWGLMEGLREEWEGRLGEL